jgi:MarR family transcriptional regulator, multiple antibiotic resistance protein MarR
MAEIYGADDFGPQKGVGYQLQRVRLAILASIDRQFATDEQLAALGATSAQFIVLATLSTGEAGSASDLCKEMSYDAGAMTRMIDRLEEKDIVRRSRSPIDRRLIKIELTEKGLLALPKMRMGVMKVLNQFLLGFTQAEARQLEGFLMRMLENAHRSR